MNSNLQDLKNTINQALLAVSDPYLNQTVADIAQLKLEQKSDYLEIHLEFGYLIKNSGVLEKQIHNAIQSEFKRVNLNQLFQLEITHNISHKQVQGELKPMKNIKNIICNGRIIYALCILSTF